MDVEMKIDPYEMAAAQAGKALEQAQKFARLQKIQLTLWIMALIFWVVLSIEYIALKHRIERLEQQLHHFIPIPTKSTIDNMTI